MSHEFRTPLHGILSFSKIGSSRIKENDIKPEKFLDFFNSINISATRLLALLNDLLDLAKLEAEQMQILCAPNDLFKITQEIVKEQQFLLAEKQLVIQLIRPQCNTIVPFDRLRIIQVISNLLSNAIKFTDNQGEICITFENSELILSDQQIPALRFNIQDNGKGIPSSELEGVFDKFIQSSRNDPGASGTGLGLAICREIIEAHQGKIWASQSSHGGAVIHIVMPRQKNSKQSLID